MDKPSHLFKMPGIFWNYLVYMKSDYVETTNQEAEIHLLKTEYLESRHVHISNSARVNPTTYLAILANLNIATIDTLTGLVDSKLIHRNLDTCRLHIQRLQGWIQTSLSLLGDIIFTDLCLRDRDHTTAIVLLAQTFTSQDILMDVALGCLERLADLSNEMSNVKTTMTWAGILLTLALKSKSKLGIMKAFRCLGQIFVAQGDDETALSLFKVALDGLSFMDVHHWRADCIVHIADICACKGEILKSVELWKAARPLFQRSSQAKDVIRINRKLDSAVMEYEKHLQELKVPIRELEKWEAEESQCVAQAEGTYIEMAI
jgi:hypothetical protein